MAQVVHRKRKLGLRNLDSFLPFDRPLTHTSNMALYSLGRARQYQPGTFRCVPTVLLHVNGSEVSPSSNLPTHAQSVDSIHFVVPYKLSGEVAKPV